MSRFWDKNNYSERDQVEETFEEQAEALLDEMEEDSEDSEDSEEEEVMEDYTPKSKSVYKLDTRESNILSDATVRLEQARLYDMLIKHDLFAGVKANPKALQNVQNELKQYIVSRLEVLLGIRQEKKEKDQPKQLVVESPFNDVEIEFLKALSYKGTKGASASAPNKKMVANEIKSLDSTYQDSSSLKPLTQQEPENLTPISEDDDDNEELARPRKTLPPKKKTVSTQRVAPKLAPTKSTQRIRRGEMSNAEAEQIALEDLIPHERDLLDWISDSSALPEIEENFKIVDFSYTPLELSYDTEGVYLRVAAKYECEKRIRDMIFQQNADQELLVTLATPEDELFKIEIIKNFISESERVC